MLASAVDRGITGQRRRVLGPRPESGESADAAPHSLVLQHCGGGLDAIAFLNVGGTVVSNQTGTVLFLASNESAANTAAALSSPSCFVFGTAAAGRYKPKARRRLRASG
jgi:uncharacterized membrane protein YoaK (UPF0700 family)